MKHYTNTFKGFTTLVLEIEQDLSPEKLNLVKAYMKQLSLEYPRDGGYMGPNSIINKHDEDIRVGHKFCILSAFDEHTTLAELNDLIEELEAAQ
jgi:hypothetical protein